MAPWIELAGNAAVFFSVALGVAAAALLIVAAPASAQDEETLQPASYPDMTTYQCRTDAITIYPGQNTNLFAPTKTCPNATKVSGPGDASVFAPGSTAEGYVTRFKPSMVELHPDGSVTTPSVWDLHLHHVVWIGPGGPTFASGEEKTIAMSPQGYGLKVGGDDRWGLNYMLHSLNADSGRQVYVTWEIDWVPETDPPRTDIQTTPGPVDGRRRPSPDLPGVRRRAGLRPQRRRSSTSSRTRSRPTPTLRVTRSARTSAR